MANKETVVIRNLGVADYVPVWDAMKRFTEQRDEKTPDEIWFLEHPPVFTQGQAGKAEHILAAGDIPVVQVDRGGQVTYHGPGQLVGYVLIDLKRLGIGIRQLVTAIEESIVRVLASHGVVANPRADAPGVYVERGAKIAQLGLRVSRGCTFHGLSLNIDMDMQPFRRINPCGHRGMEVTNMAIETQSSPSFAAITEELLAELMQVLGYQYAEHIKEAYCA